MSEEKDDRGLPTFLSNRGVCEATINIMQNEKACDCPTNNTTSTSDASYSL